MILVPLIHCASTVCETLLPAAEAPPDGVDTAVPAASPPPCVLIGLCAADVASGHVLVGQFHDDEV